MKWNCVARLLAVSAQVMFAIVAPALARPQSPAPPIVQPSASGTQQDPYAEAFSGLSYSDKQKEAISKLRQDIDLRKTAVIKDEKLSSDQKDAMLTGYVRIEYNLIFKELTPEQQKLVSARMRARREAEDAARKAKAPAR